MTTEEWRVVARNPNYEVSSLGRVRRATPYRSTEVGYILAQRPCVDGYPRVGLSYGGRIRAIAVHVLVCEAFHGPRPSPKHQAAHGDGVRTNAAASNLRWATHRENQADRVLHGTNPVGERNPAAKLTDMNIWAIRARHLLGEQNASLARCFGVSDTHIGRVVSGTLRTDGAPFDPRPFLDPDFLAFAETLS